MNVIFLDVDGVLNGSHSSWEHLKMRREGIKTPNIDEDKIKILSEISNELDCKIVLSTSWKLEKEYFDYEKEAYVFNKNLAYLLDLFDKYNIEFIGYTPNVGRYRKTINKDEMWKENDIRLYLYKHPEVEHFVVIDDETYDLKKLKDHLIITKYIGNSSSEEGLTINHKDEIRKILARENKYRRK